MSDYCFDAAHGDEVEPKSVCPWCLRERIAELEKEAEAARELAAIKYPVYSGPKSADVKKGAALSGELLYYKVLPHLMHKLDKALLGGGE